ncbi:hypothetical protein [Streptomyces sp. 3N207]|uniref:hypothetical protein n=1 Tax=Streptomyces sp. 3N207 TaxID=3457417 RepID=UPI003FD2DC7B
MRLGSRGAGQVGRRGRSELAEILVQHSACGAGAGVVGCQAGLPGLALGGVVGAGGYCFGFAAGGEVAQQGGAPAVAQLLGQVKGGQGDFEGGEAPWARWWSV